MDSAYFRLRSIDEVVADVLALQPASDTHLVHEFVRQLVAAPTEWGAGGSLPYVQLGNEIADKTCADAAGWLVLYLSEVLDECAPTVVRLFPGLPNLNRSDPAFPDLRDKVANVLGDIFFHVVRAALVARTHVGPTDRFETVLGPGLADVWADLSATLSLGDPLDLDVADPDHLEAVRTAALTHGLTAPFHVMDFHWYNSSGARDGEGNDGGFLYLSQLKGYVAEIRAQLAAWWTDGSTLPIWCTETGISSHLNPQHFWDEAVKRGGVDPDHPTEVCFGHLSHCDGAYLGGPPHTPGELGPPALRWSDLEFRIDPGEILAASLDPAAPLFYGRTLWQLPRFVFTSEREQEVQVWTRLSLLAGVGVQKGFWFTNDARGKLSGGGHTGFYGYGMTEDTWRSECDAADVCGACRISDPHTRYAERSKKPSFCAVARWGQFLGHYRCATLLRRFDGDDADFGHANRGFYAVAFRLYSASDAAARRFALVLWTDPQVFSDCAAEAPPGAPHLGGCAADRLVTFVPDDPTLTPLAVATLPRREVLDLVAHPEGVDNPCRADGEALAPAADPDTGYRGEATWIFPPDQELAYRTRPDGRSVARLGLHALHPPTLFLLPEGEVHWHDPATGADEVLLVLSDLGDGGPTCAPP